MGPASIKSILVNGRKKYCKCDTKYQTNWKATQVCVQRPFFLVTSDSNVRHPQLLSRDELPDSLMARTLNNSCPSDRTNSHLGPCCQDIHFHSITIVAQTYIDNVDRMKRDFGITAAIIIVIVLAVRVAVTGMVLLMQTTTDTFHQRLAQSAKVLHAKEVINQHLYQAIIYYNNRLISW